MPRPPRLADLVLHPVRLRVILALVGRTLTTEGLAQVLPDVPPASLYRHVKRLRDAGVVSVVAEERARGAIRRTYTVKPEAGILPAAELRSLDREGVARLFVAFCAALLADFGRYLDRPGFDLVADGVRFRQVPLYLDDMQYQRFLTELDGIIGAAHAGPVAAHRRRRTFSHIIVPGPAESAEGPVLGPVHTA